MELERAGKLSPQQFIASLEQRELDLIDELAKENAEGIIGSRSRQTLRRKPSSIYWNALRTYGFFTEPLTLSEYATLFCARRNAADYQKIIGKRKLYDEDYAANDSDTSMTGTAFWRVLTFDENWRDGMKINLNADESTYLREKILSMPGTRDSLLALILREHRLDFTKFESFDDISELQNIMPPEMCRDYCLARDFSRFIFGAQVRYNVIFSEGRNNDAKNLWAEYIEQRPTINLSEVLARLKPRANVMRFLKQFESAIGNTKELDSIIIHREKELKGVSRAKLTNKECYQYDNNNVNMDRLTYRLGNVQRIVRDIFEGVNINA